MKLILTPNLLKFEPETSRLAAKIDPKARTFVGLNLITWGLNHVELTQVRTSAKNEAKINEEPPQFQKLKSQAKNLAFDGVNLA